MIPEIECSAMEMTHGTGRWNRTPGNPASRFFNSIIIGNSVDIS
jgi:hypothetical protein